jgi:hypothetical protein
MRAVQLSSECFLLQLQQTRIDGQANARILALRVLKLEPCATLEMRGVRLAAQDARMDSESQRATDTHISDKKRTF